MFEIQLPGMLGQITRFNIYATWSDRTGWHVDIRHRHDQEPLNCPWKIELHALTTEELVQYMEDFVAAGRHRFTWVAEEARCEPDLSS